MMMFNHPHNPHLVSAEEKDEDEDAAIVVEGVSFITPAPSPTESSTDGQHEGLTLAGHRHQQQTNPNSSLGTTAANPSQSSQLQLQLPLQNDEFILTGGAGGGSGAVGQRMLLPSLQLQWNDKFFNNDEVVEQRLLVGVFDFDYKKMSSYFQNFQSVFQISGFVLFLSSFAGTIFLCHDSVCINILPNVIFISFIVQVWISFSNCYPFFHRQPIQIDALSQHVAITRDGILFVKDKYRARGRVTIIVPFDKILSCDIKEPAGYCWCGFSPEVSEVHISHSGVIGSSRLNLVGSHKFKVPKILSGVKISDSNIIDRSDGYTTQSLILVGLKEPYKFKQVLLSMIRAYHDENGGLRTVGGFNFLAPPDAFVGLQVAAVAVEMDNDSLFG